MLKVLIIEDDLNLAQAVSQILISNDMAPDIAYDGITGLEQAQLNKHDIILLDLMLPGIGGLDVCRKIKEQNIMTPVIMVTAKSTVADRIDGFDAGADDYLPKPFASQELLARIKAVARRNMPTIDEGKGHYGNLFFNYDTGELTCCGDTLVLSSKEAALMGALMEAPEEFHSKDSLLQKCWGDDSTVDSNNVEAYVSFLRKKLNFVGTNVEIETGRNKGYRLAIK